MPQSFSEGLTGPLLIATAVAAFPFLALSGEETGASSDVVAEALFLADTLPPGSHDLNVAVSLERGEDGVTGERTVVASPNLQFAAPLGGRMGFTVDLGIPTYGGIEAPGASLKFLLREAAQSVTGLSASVDVYGSLRRDVDTEVAFAFGALYPAGRFAFRATALGATGVSGWTPRLHAGLSAAASLSQRWRVLAEVTSETTAEGTSLAAGPTVKVALGQSMALMAGALFEVGGPGMPLVTFQLCQSL